MKNKISKILIANRGEIACRIIKTARKLGIRTVAVYSDVDQNARNVLMADEAYYIGKASSQDSYLNIGRIIDVAKRHDCDAIHPGYGFLSENVKFSESCYDNKIVFIGPPASAIRDMGIKSTSKKIMLNAGVPVIPGYHGEDQSNMGLECQANDIGFPLMIKAVYGGGGKGMRIAFKKEEFILQLESARRESLNSFGDQSVLLEKFIVAPRHIEVQVFADRHGNCVHLNERDCSIQRRHQKVIEEAPAPGIDKEFRESIGSAAVQAAKAVNYVGAGTVEFIYNELSKDFYFMEMNTRLQVEHPITEMITKLDLVEWQIKVANGEELPLKQDDIPLLGHSVEARIYAEDPLKGFLPGSGPLIYFKYPKETNDVRVETGFREGDEVSIHYDPMIAKLVVWAETREEAFAKLQSKLFECNIIGLNTNVEFLANLCSNQKLLEGKLSTAFIDENKDELFKRIEPTFECIVQATLGLVLWEEKTNKKNSNPYDPFVSNRGFRVNHLYTRDLNFRDRNENQIPVKITYKKNKSLTVQIGGSNPCDVDGFLIDDDDDDDGIQLVTNFCDRTTRCKIFLQDDKLLYLFTPIGSFRFEIWSPKFDKTTVEERPIAAVAPMPGIVNKIFVKSGDEVKIDDTVMVVIAMKMEHVIKSPKDGIIKEVLFEVGQNVPKNMPVIEFKE